ncbi:MAG TPA: hypothetical protein VEX16_05425 [Methyloceanibacter sp.]|nr:hypothetical protein [Methyloceanibacter sp.]
MLCALTLPPLHSAHAEFEIPGVDAERGAVEIEYRGASHWGLPKQGEDADEDEEVLLRQSHEVEFQLGITDFLMLRVTPNVEEPDGESMELVSLGVEAQFVLKPRDDGRFGLAFMLGYGPTSNFVDVDEPDEFEFGPVMELASERWLLTANPRLVEQLGEFADQEGLGFEYATQLKYQFAARWAVAALMFGEIESLAHAGPFEAQSHVLGPGLYFSNGAEEGGEADDEGVRETEWQVGVGVLFGLTDATADAALRVTASVEY